MYPRPHPVACGFHHRHRHISWRFRVLSALLFYERHFEVVVVAVVAIVNVLTTTNGDQSASVAPLAVWFVFCGFLVYFFFSLSLPIIVLVSIFALFSFNLVPEQVASLWAR